MVKFFLLGFAQVCLIAWQTRNYAQSRYTLSFITSLFIASLWWLTVVGIKDANMGIAEMFGYVLGNALGGISGIWLQKAMTRKKDVAKW